MKPLTEMHLSMEGLFKCNHGLYEIGKMQVEHGRMLLKISDDILPI